MEDIDLEVVIGLPGTLTVVLNMVRQAIVQRHVELVQLAKIHQQHLKLILKE